MNSICGEKISIISPSPQTTRNSVRGICHDPRGQLLFLDTPGYHNSEKKFNLHLQRIAKTSLTDADIILYVADATRQPGAEEHAVLELLSQSNTPIIAAVNKCDLPVAKPGSIQQIISDLLGSIPFIRTSAENGTGISELLDGLFSLAPEGEPYYPSDYYTDQPPEFRIAEIIREEVINRVSDEIPHAVYIEVSDIEANEETNTLWIRAFIQVEKESQKGIVVGKKGAMIRAIRKASQKGLAAVFGYSISLDLRVKVHPKWRKNESVINRLIF